MILRWIFNYFFQAFSSSFTDSGINHNCCTTANYNSKRSRGFHSEKSLLEPLKNIMNIINKYVDESNTSIGQAGIFEHNEYYLRTIRDDEEETDLTMECSIFIDQKMLQKASNSLPQTSKTAYKINDELFYEERCSDADKAVEFEVFAEPTEKYSFSDSNSDSESLPETTVKRPNYNHRDRSDSTSTCSSSYDMKFPQTLGKCKTEPCYDSDSDCVTESSAKSQNRYFGSGQTSTSSSPCHMPFSYANIAKKPKDDTPNNVRVDLRARTIYVRFDSYHMIVTPKIGGSFWCMACETFENNKNKSSHCKQSEHLTNLSKCSVVEEYKMHFVRKVTDMFYHCGNCNNLQMVHLINEHLEKNHPPKKPNENRIDKPATIDTVNDKKPPNAKADCKLKSKTSVPHLQDSNNANTTTEYTEKNNAPIPDPNTIPNGPNADPNGTIRPNTDPNGTNGPNTNKNHQNNLIGAPLIDYYHNIDMYIFGNTVSLPLLNFNVVCARPFDFYCGLCDMAFQEYQIPMHLRQVGHVEMLRRTIFLAEFNYHLIRVIRDVFHCAVCNIPIIMNAIYLHIQELQHLVNLQRIIKPNMQTVPQNMPNIPYVAPNSAYSHSNIRNPSPYGRSPEVFNVLYTNNLGQPTNNYQYPIHNMNPNSVLNRANDQTSTNVDSNVTKEASGTAELRNEKEDSNSEENSTPSGESPDLNGEDPDLNEETEEDANEFDFETHVYLNIKTNYVKVSLASFNTLVAFGTSARHCFLCTVDVKQSDLNEHINYTKHLENMEKHKILEDYGDDVMRQIGLTYHCAICNVITSRNQVKMHLSWPTHVSLKARARSNDKKKRRKEIKDGVLKVDVTMQKEEIYFLSNEPNVKILLNGVMKEE